MIFARYLSKNNKYLSKYSFKTYSKAVGEKDGTLKKSYICFIFTLAEAYSVLILKPYKMKQLDILTTDRLHLRPLTLDDADALFSYFSKDEVMTYYDLAPFETKDEAENLINLWNNRLANDEGCRWAICLKENTSRAIGTAGFHNISKENNRAEIGYELHPDFWGKGIATEVSKKIIDYGFQTLKYRRLEAFIDPRHGASRKVLHKSGMETEGILREYFYEKGVFVDAEILSILNPNRK